jgi:hypothetical protein
MAGATGLDYTAVHATMGMLGLPKKHRAELFNGVRACEAAALQAWAEKA